MSHNTDGSLQCDMDRACKQAITHIDVKGYVYCKPHGIERKASHRCRKLTPTELRTLEAGQPITY